MSAGPALPILLCALLVVEAPGAAAGDDHNRARDAVQAGRILPLERILESARARFGGDVLDVELEDEDAGFRYEIKLIVADGRILKLEYDAATGELLHARGRDRRHGERR